MTQLVTPPVEVALRNGEGDRVLGRIVGIAHCAHYCPNQFSHLLFEKGEQIGGHREESEGLTGHCTNLESDRDMSRRAAPMEPGVPRRPREVDAPITHHPAKRGPLVFKKPRP